MAYMTKDVMDFNELSSALTIMDLHQAMCVVLYCDKQHVHDSLHLCLQSWRT